jgi:hypothetical protein
MKTRRRVMSRLSLPARSLRGRLASLRTVPEGAEGRLCKRLIWRALLVIRTANSGVEPIFSLLSGSEVRVGAVGGLPGRSFPRRAFDLRQRAAAPARRDHRRPVAANHRLAVNRQRGRRGPRENAEMLDLWRKRCRTCARRDQPVSSAFRAGRSRRPRTPCSRVSLDCSDQSRASAATTASGCSTMTM